MSTTLILESNGAGTRWLLENQGPPGEITSSVLPDFDSDIESDPGESADVESIELRVRDEDIRTDLSRIAVVLAGIPGRAADKLGSPAKIVITAGIDVQGTVQIPLEEPALRAEMASIAKSHSPIGWVVSGMNSHRNPVHERRVSTIALEVTARPTLEGRFWSDSLNAVERARAARQAAVHAIRLTGLVAIGEQVIQRLGRPLRLRTAPLDSSSLAALLNCPSLSSLVRIFEGPGSEGPSLQARVTRSEKGYSCHCTDGYFEFESITQARSFAAQHLREQMAQHARQLGVADETVTITQEDRYTQVRGRRGPVRVYLETIITARRAR